jgi:hypothetical protein
MALPDPNGPGFTSPEPDGLPIRIPSERCSSAGSGAGGSSAATVSTPSSVENANTVTASAFTDAADSSCC